jgi:hypothetical protein
LEGRNGACDMIQRRFDLKPEPSVSPDPAAAKPPEGEPPAAPLPPILHEASGLELRERQMRWIKERLRFETSLESQGPPQGTK